MKTFTTIDAYIGSFPKEIQKLLTQMRVTTKKVVPQAKECIKYGIPTFQVGAMNLIHFGGFADHVSFFPTSSGVSAFKKELKKYKISKGTIQFPLDQKLPLGLISKIVKFRMKETIEEGMKKGILYHTDGSIWGKGKKVKGLMEGYWEWYRKDGSKMRSGHLMKDKQVGKWTTYDAKGKVVKVTNFK